MCLCVSGREREKTVTEKERGGYSIHWLSLQATQVLVEERKLSLLDRCLLTGLSLGHAPDLEWEELYCPGKRA